MDAPEVPHNGGGGGHDGKVLDALKHRYHGVPGYAIAAGIVAAIVIVAKVKGKGGAATGTTNPNGAALVPNTGGSDGGGGGGGASGDPFQGGTLIGTTIPDAGFDTTGSAPDASASAVSAPVALASPSSSAAPLPTITGQGALVGSPPDPQQQAYLDAGYSPGYISRAGIGVDGATNTIAPAAFVPALPPAPIIDTGQGSFTQSAGYTPFTQVSRVGQMVAM